MAPPAKALRAPVLPKHLEPRVITELAAEDAIEQCRLDGCALAEAVAPRVRFDGVRIVGGTLGASKLTELGWIDVACERCDFSMIVWPGARLTRVELRGCRMTGAKLVEGELESVRFVDCHLDYAMFADTRFRQVTFESCRIEEADFAGPISPGPRSWGASSAARTSVGPSCRAPTSAPRGAATSASPRATSGGSW